MNRNGSPLKMPVRNSSLVSPERPKNMHFSQDMELSPLFINQVQILDKSILKDSCPSRTISKPCKPQKDYKIRSNYKSVTPFIYARKAICSQCRNIKCVCSESKNQPLQSEEIDSEPDEKMSMELYKDKDSKTTYLFKSSYNWRLPTVVFDYPLHCNKKSRITSEMFKMKEEDLRYKPLLFKVSEGAVSYNCFLSAFLFNGFEQTSSSSYNVIISSVPKPDHIRDLNLFQKINHFPGIWQLGRKDNLWKNILKMRRKFGKVYDFCPYTYLLPEDYSRLKAVRKENPKMLWILKPSAMSCGRGIKVLSGKSKIPKKSGCIVSKYITNPHTINGYKYDLRIYVGVISFDPLKIYIYQDGLVRFATEKYSTKKKSLKKRYIHLTNFSVNKKSSKFVKNTSADIDGQGSKWSLRALRKKYLELNIDYDQIFSKIEDIVIKTIIAVEPHVVISVNQGSKYKNNCFETYGFDIILDDNLQPWLLEVNVCPSLASSSPLDKQIKTSLMCDIFTLAGISPYDRAAFEKEQEYIKSSRLYGFEKNSKLGHRNITALNACSSLDEYILSSEDLDILIDLEEDSSKCGNFKRIFPLKNNIDIYSKFFDVARYNNTLLWKHLKSNFSVLNKFIKTI